MISQISQNAKIYSQALFELMSDGVLSCQKIIEDLDLVSLTIKNSKDLQDVLLNPSYTIEQKTKIVEDIFLNKIDNNILNLLKVITEKQRFDEFEDIVADFKNKINDKNGIKEVTVISATELSNENKDIITNKLSELLNKKAQPVWQTDPGIIAGLVIQIDDNIIDTSVKSKLEKLSKNIIKGIK